MKIAKELKKLSDKYRESNFLWRRKRHTQTALCMEGLCAERAFVSGKKGDA